MDHDLPPLKPDIAFSLLPTTEEAFRASFEIKRDAMAEHVIKYWGWAEDIQSQIHRKHFETKPFFQIDREGVCVGTVSILPSTDHVRFGEFYLLGRYRGNGLGTRILKHCLAFADEKGLPVRLEYLKWNPVGTLYLRHGFSVTGETDIHYLMQRACTWL